MTDTKLQNQEGSSEDIKQVKYQRNLKIIFKLQENKHKQKILKKPERRKNTLPIEEQGYVLHQTSHQKPCKQESSRAKCIKVLKEKKNKHKPKVLYAVKLYFRHEGEIKMSSDKN